MDNQIKHYFSLYKKLTIIIPVLLLIFIGVAPFDFNKNVHVIDIVRIVKNSYYKIRLEAGGIDMHVFPEYSQYLRIMYMMGDGTRYVLFWVAFLSANSVVTVVFMPYFFMTSRDCTFEMDGRDAANFLQAKSIFLSFLIFCIIAIFIPIYNWGSYRSGGIFANYYTAGLLNVVFWAPVFHAIAYMSWIAGRRWRGQESDG